MSETKTARKIAELVSNAAQTLRYIEDYRPEAQPKDPNAVRKRYEDWLTQRVDEILAEKQQLKNMGGAVLGSEGHDTLDPIVMGEFTMKVVRLPEVDTYIAGYFEAAKPERFRPLAAHPNGHSCKELLKRIAGTSRGACIEQWEYIIRCGGMGVQLSRLIDDLNLLNLKQT